MEKKEAFKIVNEFIKKYYPFAYGKPWDREHGNIHFMYGSYALEEYIETFANDDINITEYEKAMDEVLSNEKINTKKKIKRKEWAR